MSSLCSFESFKIYLFSQNFDLGLLKKTTVTEKIVLKRPKFGLAVVKELNISNIHNLNHTLFWTLDDTKFTSYCEHPLSQHLRPFSIQSFLLLGRKNPRGLLLAHAQNGYFLRFGGIISCCWAEKKSWDMFNFFFKSRGIIWY